MKKYCEIEKMFTEEVKELTALGYVINAHTMSHSIGGGVHCKVDFKVPKSEDIIRVVLFEHKNSEHGEEREKVSPYTLVLRVGRVSEARRRFSIDEENIAPIKPDVVFYVPMYSGLTEKSVYFETKDEAERVYDIRRKRAKARCRQYAAFDDTRLPEAARAIALKYAKKQRGFKSAKLSDVTDVMSWRSVHAGTAGVTVEMYGYRIRVKGKWLSISAPNRFA